MPIIKGHLSVSEFRACIGDAIGTVRYGDLGTRVDIINRNKPVAVLISVTSADFLTKIINLAKLNRHEEINTLVTNYLPPTTSDEK